MTQAPALEPATAGTLEALRAPVVPVDLVEQEVEQKQTEVETPAVVKTLTALQGPTAIVLRTNSLESASKVAATTANAAVVNSATSTVESASTHPAMEMIAVLQGPIVMLIRSAAQGAVMT